MKKELVIGLLNSSAAAILLKLDSIDEIIYTHIGPMIYDDDEDYKNGIQHADSLRFVRDLEVLYDRKVTILQHPIYKDVNHVQNAFQFINSRFGAKCTSKMKIEVRKMWELEHKEYDITYIRGFDSSEKDRADNIELHYPEHKHIFPLIKWNMNKQDCHGLIEKYDIKRPILYDLGFLNNNFIGCVKGGMWYWNQIRIHFPERFKQQALMEREVGKSCLTDKDGQLFLDELEPGRGRKEDEIMTDCSIICQIAHLESENDQ